jgi:hypothetical protein
MDIYSFFQERVQLLHPDLRVVLSQGIPHVSKNVFAENVKIILQGTFILLFEVR